MLNIWLANYNKKCEIDLSRYLNENSVIVILNLLEILLLRRHSQRMHTVGFKNNCANVLSPLYKNVRSYTQKTL